MRSGVGAFRDAVRNTAFAVGTSREGQASNEENPLRIARRGWGEPGGGCRITFSCQCGGGRRDRKFKRGSAPPAKAKTAVQATLCARGEARGTRTMPTVKAVLAPVDAVLDPIQRAGCDPAINAVLDPVETVLDAIGNHGGAPQLGRGRRGSGSHDQSHCGDDQGSRCKTHLQISIPSRRHRSGACRVSVPRSVEVNAGQRGVRRVYSGLLACA